MYPEFGSDLGPILWEPHDVFLQQQIRKELTRALAIWEPRVELVAVVFDANAYLVNLGILIIAITLRLVNNPKLHHVVHVPISSQGRLFSH